MGDGSVGPVGAIFLFIIFLVIWFVFLAGYMNDLGASVISQNGLTGIEAFAFSNLNLIIFISMLLGMLGWVYFSTTL